MNESMQARLARLESQLDRRRSINVLPWLLMTLIALSGWSRAQDPPEEITARSFVIRGEKGSGEWSIDADGRPQLVLRDAQNHERIALRVEETGDSTFQLLDRTGAARVELSLLDEATPRLMLSDETGQDRLKLFLMPDGSSLIYMKDSDGRNRVELANTVTNLKGFVTFDRQSHPRVLLGELPDVPAALWMRDGPVNLFELNMNPGTGAAATIRNPQGEVAWTTERKGA